MRYKPCGSSSSNNNKCPMINFGYVVSLSQGIPYLQSINQPGHMLTKKMQYSAVLRRPSNVPKTMYGANNYNCKNGNLVPINVPTVVRSVPLNDFHRH